MKSSIIVNNGSENLELWEEETRRERIVTETWYTTIVASPCTIQLAVPLLFAKPPFKENQHYYACARGYCKTIYNYTFSSFYATLWQRRPLSLLNSLVLEISRDTHMPH